jgi:hypothetical protein
MLWPVLRQSLLFVSLLAILSVTGASTSQSFAQAATEDLPVKTQPDNQSINATDLKVNIGIGHLALPIDIPLSAGDNSWLKDAKIVLYNRPQGQPFGKLENGILTTKSRDGKTVTRPMSHAILETGYGIFTFPVLEKRGNWYRIRYQVGTSPDGTAWVEAKQIASGKVPFRYQSWQSYFQGADVSSYFLTEKNYVFDRPSAAGKRSVAVEGSIKIKEFRGDWMKVTFRERTYNCDETPVDRRNKVITGWVKWRVQGRPLLWVAVKGC